MSSPNQNLFRIANERTTFAEAFRLADEVLHSGVRGITDLMVMPGFMNLDFADVKTVMGEMGKAMMGTGEADGDNRAIRAAEAAISNPLLDDVSMKGARGVLINITGGLDMTLFEVDQAANRIREEVDPEAQIKVGSTLGEDLDGRIRVSVIATGIEAAVVQSQRTGTGAGTINVRGPAMPQKPVAQHPQVAAQQARVQAPMQQQPQVMTPSINATSTYFTMPQAVTPANGGAAVHGATTNVAGCQRTGCGNGRSAAGLCRRGLRTARARKRSLNRKPTRRSQHKSRRPNSRALSRLLSLPALRRVIRRVPLCRRKLARCMPRHSRSNNPRRTTRSKLSMAA